MYSTGQHTRPAGRDGRHRAAAPAGDLDGLGDAGRGRTGPHRDEVLPGRGRRRRAVPGLAGQPVASAAILPHRRHHRGPAGHYLKLPNVGCVGGSWVTPADALAEGDWARVTKLAEAAVPAAP